ncbi:MAG TPA: methylated-DNA--[protein]-cysteine S-methyltransferase, partial [Beijerinckiaceae bacterium]|nr:methylated-DNA--[protein]-cysteine S-methyltransferase [Beijerinckiaceae bacterium]
AAHRRGGGAVPRTAAVLVVQAVAGEPVRMGRVDRDRVAPDKGRRDDVSCRLLRSFQDMTRACALFATPIGACALIWGGNGICGVQLPEVDDAAAVARLRRRWPDARADEPSAEAQAAIDEIGALLQGRPHDFMRFRLDRGGITPFNDRVYDQTLAIPPGETRSYGDIARALGDIGLSRAVGTALGENPLPILIPCHRVMAAKGGTGGFSAPGGLDTKFRLLNIEQAFARPEPNLFGDTPLPLARRQ